MQQTSRAQLGVTELSLRYHRFTDRYQYSPYRGTCARLDAVPAVIRKFRALRPMTFLENQDVYWVTGYPFVFKPSHSFSIPTRI